MNRFNLTFRGIILPGNNPEQAMVRFAQLFDITDPQQLHKLFSGEVVVLRRDLDRKTAADYFSKLRKIGIESELVKVPAVTKAKPEPKSEVKPQPERTPEPAPAPAPAAKSKARPKTKPKPKSKPKPKPKLKPKTSPKPRPAAPPDATDTNNADANVTAKIAPGIVKASTAPAKSPAVVSKFRRISKPDAKPVHKPATSGQPNLYQLHPFTADARIQARAARARQQKRRAMGWSGIFAATLLLLTGYFISLAPPQVLTGASAVAVPAGGGPVLLADKEILLHDRAGVSNGSLSFAQLGIATLQPPLYFDANKALLGIGRLNEGASLENNALLRCELEKPACTELWLPDAQQRITGFAVHPSGDFIIIATADPARISKLDDTGAALARVEKRLPDKPQLRVDAGLLLVNSAQAPAISVFRYDDDALGKQLDEILLLPSEAMAAGQDRVIDFVRVADNWWVALSNPDSGDTGLYRFDTRWNTLGAVAVDDSYQDWQLTAWGEKVLLHDNRQVAMLRFNAAGEPEAPFTSTLLADRVSEREWRNTLRSTAWRGTLLMLALLATAAALIANVYRVRGLVYSSTRMHSAAELDSFTQQPLHWLSHVTQRRQQLKNLAIAYTALVLALLLIAIGVAVSVWVLAALMLLLGAGGLALWLYSRSPPGHIGIGDNGLVLVDHSNLYHTAQGAQLQHRGPFLLSDDVVVFTGMRLLPAFNAQEIHRHVHPLLPGAIRVDRKTVLIKLLQSRHPLAVGGTGLLFALAVSVALVLLAL